MESLMSLIRTLPLPPAAFSLRRTKRSEMCDETVQYSYPFLKLSIPIFLGLGLRWRCGTVQEPWLMRGLPPFPWKARMRSP